jgi:hypothetical protein
MALACGAAPEHLVLSFLYRKRLSQEDLAGLTENDSL